MSIVDVSQYLDKPLLKVEALKVCDALSFCEYVNKHKGDGTLATCSVSGLNVQAVLDHHSMTEPGTRKHSCTLQLESSPDWKKWTGIDSRGMSQGEFADFLLEMDHTVIEPDAASIIEIATKLRLESNKKFESKVNMHDGSFTFHFSDEATQVKNQMKLPENIHVQVSPFRGAKIVNLPVKVRYRLNEGKLSLFFKVVNPHIAIEEAFYAVVNECELGTSLTVLRQS